MQDTRSRPTVRGVYKRLDAFHRTKLAFLLAGGLSLVLSVSLWFTGSREEALFVGLWVPAVHSLGTLVLTGERRGADR